MQVKITQIGNSKGIILPKDVLDKLNLDKGDTLWLVDSPLGFSASVYDPEFAEQMDAARAIMKKRKNVLHELAK
ncbi:MAG TPA: AbrB/MazE/SpoVT family DNA-binding domain-containing protein [Alphaproteobacteria bacterium]|nr:AbrB/MazE/SpoVT family DNA-binding domain-containing protein [Alphaproteobacteria bacterium]HOO50001.1 AbrB/MazE/SpoVT family DNA-binding domain-containing protein [Alphaproteobacteria bacterium]